MSDIDEDVDEAFDKGRLDKNSLAFQIEKSARDIKKMERRVKRFKV
jgi:hypothetical protein